MYPFWRINGSTVDIRARALISFLGKQGFGRFQTVEGRTQKTELFKNDKGVLQIHDASSIKNWLIEYVETTEEYEDSSGNKLQIDEGERFDVSDKLIKTTPSVLQNWMQSLSAWSESGLQGTKKINMFRDDEDNCYIPFKNGVVHITAKKVELLDSDALADKGCI
jgi:hypothetical protein